MSRSCIGALRFASAVTVACMAACVSTDFAEGQFLCDPAASSDGQCPDGMVCAADGRCRSSENPGAGGSGGSGGAAGAGVGGLGIAGGGGSSCLPLDCADALPACDAATPNGCGQTMDCTGACPVGSTCGGGGIPGQCGCPAELSEVSVPGLVSQTAVGTYANPWVQLTSMAALDDSAVVTESELEDGRDSDMLHITHFGFDLPVDAEVLGIEFRMWHRKNWAGAIHDKIVRLELNSITTSSFPAVGAWPDTYTERAYGSNRQLWDRVWTAAEINDDAFGIRLVVQSDAGTGSPARPRIDYLEMEVYYRPVCPVGGR